MVNRKKVGRSCQCQKATDRKMSDERKRTTPVARDNIANTILERLLSNVIDSDA